MGEWAWAMFLLSCLFSSRLPPRNYLVGELRAWGQPDYQRAQRVGPRARHLLPTFSLVGFWVGLTDWGQGDLWTGPREASAWSIPRPESAVETAPVLGNAEPEAWAGERPCEGLGPLLGASECGII